MRDPQSRFHCLLCAQFNGAAFTDACWDDRVGEINLFASSHVQFLLLGLANFTNRFLSTDANSGTVHKMRFLCHDVQGKE